MASGKFAKFGGGGNPCTVCTKTVYPAETVQFEKKPYHAECFSCVQCKKKKLQPSNAALFEEKIYCRMCFKNGGFAQKQTKTKWEGKKSKANALSGRFGGGGQKCTVCTKTVYPAETVQFEKKPYHAECFRCNECKKNKLSPSDAALFDGGVYCRMCFQRGGYAQKQTKVKWEKKASSPSAGSSKFGGGGNPCTVCSKTVYPAETVQFEKLVYHGECFKCAECKKRMTPSSASKFEDIVYCRLCFERGGYAQKQAKVKWTKKEGTSSAASSKFGGGGSKCVNCEKTVYPAETVQFEGRPYHEECFKCGNCKNKTSVNNAEWSSVKTEMFCRKCFLELGLNRATLEKKEEAAEAEAAE